MLSNAEVIMQWIIPEIKVIISSETPSTKCKVFVKLIIIEIEVVLSILKNLVSQLAN